MSKSLDALKALGEHHCSLMQKYECEKCKMPCTECKYMQEEMVIEKELKDKEKQDHYVETLEDRLNNVETTCGRYKQALEIIRNKRVNADLLYYSKNLDDYNRNITMDNRMLTQEEFDLLKEVLLCD